MKRTQAQNKQIWGRVAILGKRSGLGRDRAEAIMRAICKEITGDTSTSSITPAQADALIAGLSQSIAQIKPAPDETAAITKKQQKTLQGLYNDAAIFSQPDFNKRIIKKSWPQTRAEAIKIHQALEKMVIRRHHKSELLHMLDCLADEVVNLLLSPFERRFTADLKGRDQSRPYSAGQIGKLLEIYKKHIVEAGFNPPADPS